MKRPRTFDEIEQMVLAELLSNEFAVAIADTTPAPAGLERADFANPFHGNVFVEIRNLQQKPAEFEAAYRDAKTIEVTADQMATKGEWILDHGASPAWEVIQRLTKIVRAAPRYDNDFGALFPRHLRELRAIASQRRILYGAA